MGGQLALNRYRIGMALLGLSLVACGCAAPPDAWGPAPVISQMTPGARARLAPPETGRGAYGSPDPYYQSAPSQRSPAEGDGVDIRRDRDREYVDDGLRFRDRGVSRAGYDDRDRGDWRSAGDDHRDSGLRLNGMPKSGEPRRFRTDPNLVELTDLPPSGFGAPRPRSSATLVQPSQPRLRRTPYREDLYDRQYDDDYERSASTASRSWRRRD